MRQASSSQYRPIRGIRRSASGRWRERREPVARRQQRRWGKAATRQCRYKIPVIDPLNRWRELGEKPDYCGLLTYASLPYTESPAELEGVDVAIVGAPMDELVSDRPGARFGPRAIRAASCPRGVHLDTEIDGFEVLSVVDFGDAAVVPGAPERSHMAIRRCISEVLEHGAVPITLGGDHSITEPILAACHEAHGPAGLVHFDTHTDTGDEVFGAMLSHGTVMRHVVESGHVDGGRYVQIGPRGYWPPPEIFEWQADRGIRTYRMAEIAERGIASVVDDAIANIGAGPVYLSVDVDVLDPSVAPGTGTPEPGGMNARDLLDGVRKVCAGLHVVGVDVVEVAPQAIGSSDITALVADRVVREAITGLALAAGS